MSTKTDEEIVNKLFLTDYGNTRTATPVHRINPFITREQILDIITTLRKEQEEAVAEAVKKKCERIAELIESTIQEERFSGAPYALNKLKEALITQNTKTDGMEEKMNSMMRAFTPQETETYTVAPNPSFGIDITQNTKTDTTNSDRRDEDQHREQCEGRY